MIHPVFRLLASQPLLLAEHSAAYTELLSAEWTQYSTRLKRRMVLQLTGAACLTAAAVLTGVALLLWASLPLGEARLPWVFTLVPAVPAALGVGFLWLAQARETTDLFANVRRQLAADAELLRASSPP